MSFINRLRRKNSNRRNISSVPKQKHLTIEHILESQHTQCLCNPHCCMQFTTNNMYNTQRSYCNLNRMEYMLTIFSLMSSIFDSETGEFDFRVGRLKGADLVSVCFIGFRITISIKYVA